MPTYATRSDLTRLGVPAAALAGISTDAQDAALASASEVADSYLRARFVLPLQSWGDDLRQAVCQITAWRLIATRGLDPSGNSHEVLRAGYEDAIGWLKRVTENTVSPSVTDSSSAGYTVSPMVSSQKSRGW